MLFPAPHPLLSFANPRAAGAICSLLGVSHLDPVDENAPIARQALFVVAPEYNRFAPVLAKPVRPGLDALARGSLLQNYALAVAVARLTENPVEHAAATLAAADAEGEATLRRVLRSRPWATRRRIETHLRRLMDSKSAAKITSGQPSRGQFAARFHKLCSNPTNFGSLRPTNCESESRNYARSGGAGR